MRLLSLLCLLFLLTNCNQKNDVEIYNDFDSQNLEPVNTQKSNKIWYLRVNYKDGLMKQLSFIDKKSNKIILDNEVIYEDGIKYIIHHSPVFDHDKIQSELYCITFIEDEKLQRYYFIRQGASKYYFTAMVSQFAEKSFKRYRVNTIKYCLGFKKINDFIFNINEFKDKKYFFDHKFELFLNYKRNKLTYNLKAFNPWGIDVFSDQPVNINYKNYFLDMKCFEVPIYLYDDGIYDCIKYNKPILPDWYK